MARNLRSFAAFLAIFLTFLIHSSDAADREYDYSNNSPRGPQRWASLHRSWTLCSSGSLQSPINLTKETVLRDKTLHKLDSNYNSTAIATVLDWKEDVVLNFPDNAGDLMINATQYKLVQIRIHSPSEHMLEGKTFPAEVHLVHNSTDGSSRIAIVAFYFKLGRPNTFIGQVIDALNSTQNSGELNPTLLKMVGRPYYRYSGSLTSPPCTEGVDWYVVKKNRRMSVDQFQFIHSYVNGSNARPMQPANGREIEAYK
ncbi:alpha carbonic anhydrase 7 [Selaginella moellendorffii]|uniref:alpha carbonic anhydrase 7 n=1 Tax=Selaginella moellendorffii TaxID=88036 RepID=UPI000D1C41A0|nr:alpha carbonic anhydrase 7 [Selaginella moellendorffii]|eukprot:XP_024545261.1 alpha carbonic anhydrase 7 [Selaginella moellendorffii]